MPRRMQQHAKRDDQAAKQNRVGERIRRRFEPTPVRVELGERLPQRHRRAAVKLGGDRLEQSNAGQAAKRFLRRPRAQDLVVLLQQARRGAARDLVPVPLDRVDDRRIDREIQPRGERHRAQHPNRILEDADFRIADRSHDTRAQIVEPADVIDDRKSRDVVEERVNREVAAEGVFLGCAEGVVVMNQRPVVCGGGRAALLYGGLMDRRRYAVRADFFAGRDLPPEGGDLDHLRPEFHVSEAETPADDPAVPKQLLDLIGVRGGADVEVFRPSSEQQVADAAADEISDVVELPEPVEDLERVGINVLARDRMLGARNSPRFWHSGAIVPKASVMRTKHLILQHVRDSFHLWYHRDMRPLALTIAALLAFTVLAGAADKPDPLAHARLLYNERQFAAAVSEAEQARLLPSRADSADLIAARAYLERFRQSGESDDLTNARERLRRLDPQRLAGSERAEFLVGLREALYFDGDYGAAADVFEPMLVRPNDLMPDARELVLDWWASALDRDARPRSDAERTAVYRRIRDRMQDEVGNHPASLAAAY